MALAAGLPSVSVRTHARSPEKSPKRVSEFPGNASKRSFCRVRSHSLPHRAVFVGPGLRDCLPCLRLRLASPRASSLAASSSSLPTRTAWRSPRDAQAVRGGCSLASSSEIGSLCSFCPPLCAEPARGARQLEAGEADGAVLLRPLVSSRYRRVATFNRYMGVDVEEISPAEATLALSCIRRVGSLCPGSGFWRLHAIASHWARAVCGMLT